MLEQPILRAAALVTGLGAMPALADGDVKKGQLLAETHCARCHVVGDFNKFGGIGSTPSLQAIAGMDDGLERIQTFFERRPHPAFVTVPDVPKWSKAAPYATPFTVTAEAIDDLLAFAATLKAKRLERVPVVRGFGRPRKPRTR